MHDRAAQFSPFASLTGYDDIIHESGRETEEHFGNCDDAISEIDRQLVFLEENIKEKPTITVTYFEKDPLKEGGCYRTRTEKAACVDAVNQVLVFCDKTAIPFQDILSVSGAVFERMR